MRMTRLPIWFVATTVAVTFGVLLLLELRRPLRRRNVEPKLRRDARNFVFAAISAATIQLAEMPVALPLAAWTDERGFGLLKLLALPSWLEVTLAVVLLDYTLYVWHMLNHKVPLLWRCHLPHHVDLDMDASTAVRFHFAELLTSVPWRAGQIVLLGVSPLALSIWQTTTLILVLFHHSNVELPLRVERWLCLIIVTPRMHGIHHSIAPGEQNSNWSSGLSVWDRLHRTLRLNVPHDAITIGVPAYRAPADVTLPRVLVMPFSAQRPSWEPDDGVPQRPTLPGRTDQMLA